MRVSGGGTDSFIGFEYFGLITLASREFRVLLAVLSASLRCLRILASPVSLGVATPPLLPTLTVYLSSGTFTVFLGMCGVWSCVLQVAFVVITRTVPAQVLLVFLRSVADVATFSPILRFSR